MRISFINEKRHRDGRNRITGTEGRVEWDGEMTLQGLAEMASLGSIETYGVIQDESGKGRVRFLKGRVMDAEGDAGLRAVSARFRRTHTKDRSGAIENRLEITVSAHPTAPVKHTAAWGAIGGLT